MYNKEKEHIHGDIGEVYREKLHMKLFNELSQFTCFLQVSSKGGV